MKRVFGGIPAMSCRIRRSSKCVQKQVDHLTVSMPWDGLPCAMGAELCCNLSYHGSWSWLPETCDSDSACVISISILRVPAFSRKGVDQEDQILIQVLWCEKMEKAVTAFEVCRFVSGCAEAVCRVWRLPRGRCRSRGIWYSKTSATGKALHFHPIWQGPVFFRVQIEGSDRVLASALWFIERFH